VRVADHTKTATVSMHGNRYQASPASSGGASSWSSTRSTSPCRRCGPAGLKSGTAVPHHISRHSDSNAPPRPAPSRCPATLVLVSGNGRAATRGGAEVIELECGIMVYPARSEGGPATPSHLSGNR
jgi:hypothetical protein